MMLLILMGDSCIGTEIAGCLTMISQCYCHENVACSQGLSGVGSANFLRDQGASGFGQRS